MLRHFAFMKNVVSLALICIISCFVISCSNETDKLNEKYAPHDHFFFQRSFPEETLDLELMRSSMEIARKQSKISFSKDNSAEWVQEGPFNIGGRINTIAVKPNDNSTWIVGTAGGGAYRTEDEGETWVSISEDFTHLPVGDIAYDPNNPETIYIGTGDLNISGLVYVGNGLFRSTNGGDTWENIGLEETKIISKIIVNPDNSDELFVATMGNPFEETTDRGLYRSNDGGETWDQILYLDGNAGIIDMVMDPNNPSVLYAAGWNRIRTNFVSIASGDDSKIYKSTDGGDTWTVLSDGLPEEPMSRIGLQIWEGNSDVIFAVYVNPNYQLEAIFKSQNAGQSFTEVPTNGIPSDALGGFGWYFGKIAVSPQNQDQISLLGVDLYSTTDGGQSWFMSAPPWSEYIVHADKHDMVYLGTNDILLATDGGLYRTIDSGANWQGVDRIPNTQFYRVATNPHDQTVILGGAQDNGTNINYSDFNAEDWTRIFGGDGFQPIVDPINPFVYYCTVQNGAFYYFDTDFFDVIPLDQGYSPEERVNWDAPIRMDHFDNQTLYMARERVYKMESAPFGIWTAISPVLVEDSEEFFDQRDVSTIDQSTLDANVLYAGTSDGKAWVTQNGGDSWTDISAGLPGFYVTDIKASPFDESVVIITLSGYRENDETPHILLSSDYGNNWISASGNLNEMPVNHVEFYTENTWFIGSDNGVYMTDNNGVNWQRVGSNFPFVVVTDLVIQEETNRLIVGTFGVSSFSIDIEEALDDIVTSTAFQESEKLRIFPNPATTEINVEAENLILGNYSVHAMNGKLVQKGAIKGRKIQLNIPAGAYILTVVDEDRKFSSKFIVADS